MEHQREGPGKESFVAFKARALKHLKGLASESCKDYICSMPDRIEDVLERDGAIEDQKIKRSEDIRIRGSGDQRIGGSEDQEEVERQKGIRENRKIRRSKDQGIRGITCFEDQRIRGSEEDRRIRGLEDLRIRGSGESEAQRI